MNQLNALRCAKKIWVKISSGRGQGEGFNICLDLRNSPGPPLLLLARPLPDGEGLPEQSAVI
jgi:hypothetical protein